MTTMQQDISETTQNGFPPGGLEAERLTLEQAVGQKLMVSFAGKTLPPAMVETLQQQHLGGVTLFRALNIESPAQVRALTEALQAAAAASGQPPLLIAADQEGGQLMALGEGTTPFPGNMALGATRSEELTRRVGEAIGRELAAVGVNVNYAPVCDVNINPRNPVVGSRSFGEDPALVATLSAAMVAGMQAAGIAATAKHFPGHGDTEGDSHHAMPSVPHDAARLHAVEFRPFEAVIRAGVRLIMTAHLALPAIVDHGLPATLSATLLKDFLRDQLGFAGVVISDALDMKAIKQGPPMVIEALLAVQAGNDLLTMTTYMDQQGMYEALAHAARRGLLPRADLLASARRVLALKQWLAAQPRPGLEVVGCAAHQALAQEVAARAVTLVRDSSQRLPLALASDARVAAVVPIPADLTPADTSSYERPQLGAALRRYHARVDEVSIPLNPSETEVAALRERLRAYDLVVVGTINAYEQAGQAALVRALLADNVPTIVAALRLPYDLQAFPHAPTYLCTYSIQAPALDALAAALFGHIPCAGQLPVTIPRGDEGQ